MVQDSNKKTKHVVLEVTRQVTTASIKIRVTEKPNTRAVTAIPSRLSPSTFNRCVCNTYSVDHRTNVHVSANEFRYYP